MKQSSTVLMVVEGWIWWATFELARRRAADVDLAIKTAHLATQRLWNT